MIVEVTTSDEPEQLIDVVGCHALMLCDSTGGLEDGIISTAWPDQLKASEYRLKVHVRLGKLRYPISLRKSQANGNPSPQSQA